MSWLGVRVSRLLFDRFEVATRWAFATLVLAAAVMGSAQAATYTVNALDDTNDGTCTVAHAISTNPSGTAQLGDTTEGIYMRGGPIGARDTKQMTIGGLGLQNHVAYNVLQRAYNVLQRGLGALGSALIRHVRAVTTAISPNGVPATDRVPSV